MPKKKSTSKENDPSKHDENLSIKGSFLDVFKVIAKNKEQKLKEKLDKKKKGDDGDATRNTGRWK